MMTAMMLPSLVPMLLRYRSAVRKADAAPDLGWLTLQVGLGYFFVWFLIGLTVFPLGVALAAVEMKAPTIAEAVPVAAGGVVFIAGTLQFTRWKAHHLARCREAPGYDCALTSRAAAAWQLGLNFGLHCGLSCANLTAILLVVGVMDVRIMAAVTAAITLERLTPGSERIARAIGAVVAVGGFLLIVSAVRHG